MTKLILLKKLYHLIKSHPYKIILFQLLLNACLFRLLAVETNDYAKLIETLILLTNTVYSVLVVTGYVISNEDNIDS